VRRRLLLAILAALLIAPVSTTPAWAAAYDEALPDPAQEARARSLFRDLRCVVCQGQSIDESHAGIAGDLRRIIREKIAAGESDEAIMVFMVERYGVFVLMEPPVRADTYLLWFGPAFLLVLGAGVIFVTIRRAKRRAAAEPEDGSFVEGQAD